MHVHDVRMSLLGRSLSAHPLASLVRQWPFPPPPPFRAALIPSRPLLSWPPCTASPPRPYGARAATLIAVAAVDGGQGHRRTPSMQITQRSGLSSPAARPPAAKQSAEGRSVSRAAASSAGTWKRGTRRRRPPPSSRLRLTPRRSSTAGTRARAWWWWRPRRRGLGGTEAAALRGARRLRSGSQNPVNAVQDNFELYRVVYVMDVPISPASTLDPAHFAQKDAQRDRMMSVTPAV